MKKYAVILLGVALLSACNKTGIVPDQPHTQKIYRAADSSQPPSKQLSLPDAQFEHKLSQAMRDQEQQIKVSLQKSVDPEEEGLPKSLAQWMAAIEKGGGKVNYEPITSEMSPIFFVLGAVFLVSAVSTLWNERDAHAQDEPVVTNQYDMAKKYNARLCYQRDDNLVTKVVFIDRETTHDKTPACTE